MVSLSDIAKSAGVNVSTVSRALRGSDSISTEMKERIHQAAEEMGYLPKRRKLAYGMIGTIIPEVNDGYYSKLVTTIDECVHKYDYHSLISITHFDMTKAIETFKLMEAQDVRGMIIDSIAFLNKEDELTRLISESQVPIVLLTEEDVNCPTDSININYHIGINIIVKHLLKLGHKKIGYIGEVLSESRHAEFEKECRKMGVPLDEKFTRVSNERFEEGGYRTMEDLLRQPELPTAVMVSYDQFAIGALKAIHNAGLRVPDDISVVSVDNISIGAYLHQPLTSLTNPVDKMGEIAAKLIVNRIMNPEDTTFQQISLRPQLIVRQTTGKAKTL